MALVSAGSGQPSASGVEAEAPPGFERSAQAAGLDDQIEASTSFVLFEDKDVPLQSEVDWGALAADLGRFGPSSPEESFACADQVVSALETAGWLTSLVKACQGGLHMSTDYSGIGSAEAAMASVLEAVDSRMRKGPLPNDSVTAKYNLHGGHPPYKCMTQYLTVQRAGDKETSCRKMIMFHEAPMVPTCIHGDLGGRCERDVLARTP